MKKLIYSFLILLAFTLLGVKASAEVVNYQNVITDTSTIENDFKALNMDIEDYYYPTKYDYEKLYVVALGESYVNDSIQVYFYIYCSKKFPSITLNSYEYILNSTRTTATVNQRLGTSTNGLFKVKGFVYPYKEKSTIEFKTLNATVQKYTTDTLKDETGSVSDFGNSPTLKRLVSTTLSSASDFKATTTHSLLNQSFGVEINFNSFLVIEDYNVCCVNIAKDDNLANNWEWLWSNTDPYLNVFFYNFNFPDRIEYDDVIYSKFCYDYKSYEGSKYSGFGLKEYGQDYTRLTNTEHIIKEYKPGDNQLTVGKNSETLTFSTFYLGNRLDANATEEFNLKDNILSADKSKFDKDCSILLDWTTETRHQVSVYELGTAVNGGYTYECTMLDEIEMLELHYTNDGIVYKCQVVNKPVDEEEVDQSTLTDKPKEKSWWEKFFEWFMGNLPQSLILVIILIILLPAIIWLLIKLLVKTFIWLMELPFKILGKIGGSKK